MKTALIFGGTTEGRIISQTLSCNGILCHVHVATEYGEQVMQENELLKVYTGRLGPDEIKALCDSGKYDFIVDATHPFATVVSENIRNNKGTVPLFRFEREIEKSAAAFATYFDSTRQCIEQLEKTTGKIFLTTGSKELHLYCKKEEIRKRLVVRVLPGMESLKLCYDAGLEGKQIIAMQGPFSKEMNLLQLKEYGISVLVTKESGKTGGEDQKLIACKEAGVECFVIKNPSVQKNTDTISDERELYNQIEKITGLVINSTARVEITLAGIGPGNINSMTQAVVKAVKSADYIFGAERMLKSVPSAAKKMPYYLAKDIVPLLKDVQNQNSSTIKVVVLFSGDTGFFSGQKKLRKELETLDNVSIKVLPGISSIQELSAKTGIDWQNAVIISMHGVEKDVWLPELETSLANNKKIFLLTSGFSDVNFIGKYLIETNRNTKYKIWAGYNLSYDDEEVSNLSAEGCAAVSKQGLYSLFLEPVSEDK